MELLLIIVLSSLLFSCFSFCFYFSFIPFFFDFFSSHERCFFILFSKFQHRELENVIFIFPGDNFFISFACNVVVFLFYNLGGINGC